MKPREGSLWLRSIVRHDLWPLGERFEASRGSSGSYKQAVTPEVHSPSGIYAFQTMEDALENLESTCYRGAFLGRIHVWGVVQKHQHGYRAQFAYPYSLSHGVCCICKGIVNLKTDAFAIGWIAYHFSDDFSVNGVVCSACNEKYYLLDTETGYAELSELAERYGITLE